ncbi:MAG TPA: urea transporter [Conexibacter sp.]|jgi:urea transporter|nr:urea transporter [Conexibacter sp.]
MSTIHGAAVGAPHPWHEQQPALFAIETLRGIGQVDLQAKLVTGVFITAALFSAGWKPGVFGLLGAATATATAMALGVERRRIYMGLEGYCGALIGIAAVTYLGLHLSSWLVAIAAGSVVGTLTALLPGAPASLITSGIYGYNAVLVMIALGATFLAPTAVNMLYAVLAAAFSTAITAALANFFAPFGGHTLTWPFNVTTWAFLAAIPVFAAITKPQPTEEGAT